MNAPKWRRWDAVSGSQVANFDVTRAPKEACQRRWGLEKVFQRKPPEKPWQRLGTDLHAQVENYYKRGEPVTSLIAQAGMSYWPKPGPGLRVEQWFAVEIPGWPDDRAQAYAESGWPMGYGRFSGRSDLLDMSGKTPVVIDFKNLVSLNYAKKPDALASSPPMIGYAHWALTHAPAADSVILKHIVNETTVKCPTCKERVHAQKICSSCQAPLKVLPRAKEVRAELSRADVAHRWGETVETVHQMRKLSVVQDWTQYPGNRQACRAYGGCPHRDLCYGSAALIDPGFPVEELENIANNYNGETDMQASPEVSGLFIGLNRIFANGGVPDAEACKSYAAVLKEAGYLPSRIALLSDAVPLRAGVVSYMCKFRHALIGKLHEQMSAGADPGDALVDCLRPLQGIYSEYVKMAQSGALTDTADDVQGYLSLMRNDHENEVIAGLRARAERKKAVQVNAVAKVDAEAALWVFVDCRPFRIADAVISSREILEGDVFLQGVKEMVANHYRDERSGRVGFASYKEIPFGAGPMAVVNAARATILKMGPVIVYLDSHDEVQAELARSLHGHAEMYVRG